MWDGGGGTPGQKEGKLHRNNRGDVITATSLPLALVTATAVPLSLGGGDHQSHQVGLSQLPKFLISTYVLQVNSFAVRIQGPSTVASFSVAVCGVWVFFLWLHGEAANNKCRFLFPLNSLTISACSSLHLLQSATWLDVCFSRSEYLLQRKAGISTRGPL